MRFLQYEVHKLAVEKGFWPKNRSFAECISLIHAELSEALEAHRSGHSEHIGEELADVVIRTLDLSESLGIDIEQQILIKHRYNKTRPHKHNKKY